MGAPKDSQQTTAMVRIVWMRRGLVRIFVRTENSDLTPQDITSEFTINNTYVNTIAVIKTGNVVMIHGTTKSVTVNNLKIIDIPNKYKGKTSGIIRIGLGGNTLNNVYLAATGLAIYANGAYDNNAPAYYFEISYIIDIAT